MDAIVGDQSVRTFSDVVAAFSPAMVQWLFIGLFVQFVTGIIIAFRDNEFDWKRTADIGKELVIGVAIWAVAVTLSDNVGKAAYALVTGRMIAASVTNLTELLGMDVKGLLGQVVTKGPGDSTTGSRYYK